MMVKCKTIPEYIYADISDSEILNILEDKFFTKYNIKPPIIKNGMLQHWVCTSYHNNDWDYEDLRKATVEEVNLFNLWETIKGLFIK